MRACLRFTGFHTAVKLRHETPTSPSHVLLPERNFAGFHSPAPFILESVGHHAEWLHACKTVAPTPCPFDYGGALSEVVHLGNVAFRSGRKLEWDSAAFRVGNNTAAERFLRREHRAGWSL